MIDGLRNGSIAGQTMVNRKSDSDPATAVATGGTGPSRLADTARVVRRVLAGPPPVDTARVRQIADAIRTGEYRVNPAKIAEAMVNEVAGR